MNKRIVFRNETEEDYHRVEVLTREAFWNIYRPGCLEHYLLHLYRKSSDFVKELDTVMEVDGQLIGHVMYAKSAINADDGRNIPIMTFGPISIHPDFQRRGYGKQLLEYTMQRAKDMGTGALAITGNIDFYGTCGFVLGSSKDIHYYAEPRDNDVPYFLIKELIPGFLDGISGTYRDPAEYLVNEKEAEEFDKQFPPRKKLRLPGQIA